MTTDTQLAPTDTEIADLWHDSRSNRFEVISFARAVLARWGQPAHSGGAGGMAARLCRTTDERCGAVD